MSRGVPEPRFVHGSIPRIGILLTNLGTPEAPTAAAVRPYLKQFLSDPRVVEIPRALWWVILNGIILNLRPKQSAAKYAKIWSKEGSPLKLHTEAQARLLRGYLGERTRVPIVVEWAMRYGQPAIDTALRSLLQSGCDRLLVIPLYPQYAASTTATTYDAVLRSLRTIRNVPELRLVKHFHDHPGYLQALERSATDYWAVNGRPDKLLMSFHGLPRYTLERGDPYYCECQKTGRLLGEALGLSPDRYQVTFQSRFGRAEWLKPYTMDTLVELARRKTRRVDVICPGFVSDCLETLEEIAIENKAAFLSAGGGEFHAIPCLNERDTWIRALCDLALQHLHGWLPADWSQAKASEAAQLSRQRALQLGAEG